MGQIHSTAVIHDGAVIGEGTSIGAFSVIGPHVRLGKSNRIATHVVLDGHTSLGDNNQIYQFASVGAAPQDLKFRGEASTLEIGNGNIIREFTTLQPGTAGGGMRTSIGDKNLFMANSHVGHDCHLGSANVIANSVALAGHVTVGSFVTLGGISAVHQFVRLGDYCFLGGGSMVAHDVPPYCIVEGNRAALAGLNVIGLERRGFSPGDIENLRSLYKRLFHDAGVFKARLDALRPELAAFPAGAVLLNFIETSERGLCMPRRKSINHDAA
jgi:UDP-N-acetylglucosamine acyltransferase